MDLSLIQNAFAANWGKKNEMLLMKLYAVAADKLQKIVVPEFRLQI